MEPMMSPRAQALRWLAIAEKLLGGRDLVGSKTFAIRARESDPSLEAADQILAVADTLIAAEKGIQGSNHLDWYAILQLSQPTNDSELIATRYCRLALLLNPQKNMLPFADQAFRLVIDAWSVLSNPSKKAFYDAHLNFYSRLDPNPIGSTHQQDPQNSPWPQPPQQREQQQQQQQQQRQLQEQEQQQRKQQQQEEQLLKQQQQQQQQQQKQQRKQKQKQQQQKQQQQQQNSRRSPGKNSTYVTNNNTNSSPTANIHEMNNVREEASVHFTVDDQNSSFWTACPYCFHMYEYPKIYAECTLRCQKCRKAFQAVVVPAPHIVDGKEAYFYCWGYFPLGVSPSNFEKIKGEASTWSPFSPMFTCPKVLGKDEAPKKKNVPKSSVPRVYLDDDDVFVEISDSSADSDDSDVDWRRNKKKKKGKSVKRKGVVAKNVKKPQAEKPSKVRGGNGDNVNSQESVGVSNAFVAESSRKGASNNAKKPTGKAAKEWGKLDLNVEFSNEVEEPARGMRGGSTEGNGGEDNIEGIGFFEGLDEFLSSLPILSVVKDDKVKAA